MGSIKAELDIVDFWYDFYARFLPGIVFIGALRMVFLGNNIVPTGEEIIIYCGAGYIAGLIVQPISCLIIDQLEKWQDIKVTKNYVNKVKTKNNVSSKESRIIDKMHGETAFYVQLGLFSLIYFILQIIFPKELVKSLGCYPLIGMIVFFILACISTCRRFLRAKRIDKLNSQI